MARRRKWTREGHDNLVIGNQNLCARRKYSRENYHESFHAYLKFSAISSANFREFAGNVYDAHHQILHTQEDVK